MVGLPGVGPGKSPAPHAGVLPLHYSPELNLTQGLNARGANHDSFAGDKSPLEIGVFAVAVYGIIIAAQEFAFVCHHRFFAATGTTSHANLSEN